VAANETARRLHRSLVLRNRSRGVSSEVKGEAARRCQLRSGKTGTPILRWFRCSADEVGEGATKVPPRF